MEGILGTTMKTLRRLLCRHSSLGLLTLLLCSACCSISVGSAGHQRRCAWAVHPQGHHFELPDEKSKERPEVRYLPELGLYAVVGSPCHYVRLGRYFR